MQCREHRDAEIFDDGQNLESVANVQMVCRLVEDQHLRVLRECARQDDALLLAARERLKVPVAVVFHADLRKRLERRLIIPVLFPLEQRVKRIAPHQRNVHDRIVKINLIELPHDSHAARDLFSRKAGDVLTVEPHRAAVRLLGLINRAKQGGLAAPVCAEERRELVLRHIKRHVFHNGFSGDRDRDVFCFQSHLLASESVAFPHHHIDKEGGTD